MRQAVILAAGKGVRMLHLTKDIPKTLIDINGKPFISYLLENLKQAGYEKVYFIVGYKKEKQEKFFENNDFGMKIKLIHQKEQLGTGHAVSIVEPFVEGNFVLVVGDDLFSANDLGNINFYDDYNYIYGLKHNDPKKFGVLVSDNDFLVEIEEKPKNPKTNLINSGLYKFTPEIFEALKEIEKSPRGEYELTSAIDILAKKKKVKVKILKDYWIDFGRFEDVPKVEKFIKENF
ncbi:MAG: sugar phosphate nucleotidyltransferase [archaeon]